LRAAVGGRIVREFAPDPVAERDWKGQIRASVRAWAGLQARHPRAFPLVYRVTASSRGGVPAVEGMLAAFGMAGLDPAQAARAYVTLIGCLDGMLLAGYLTTYAGGAAWRRAARSVDSSRFPLYRA